MRCAKCNSPFYREDDYLFEDGKLLPSALYICPTCNRTLRWTLGRGYEVIDPGDEMDEIERFLARTWNSFLSKEDFE